MVVHQSPPLVICDLDGVIVPILPYAVQSNGGIGKTDWMDKSFYKSVFKEIFNREKYVFSDKNAFKPDHEYKMGTPFCPDERRFDLIWSSELVGNFRQMMDDGQITWMWLTSNLPWIDSINQALGFDSSIAIGANCSINDRNYKLKAVIKAIEHSANCLCPAPIIWIDDQQASKANASALRALVKRYQIAMLMVQPDTRIGISREQWQQIERFVVDPRERYTCQIRQIGSGEPGDGFATVHIKRRPASRH